MVEKLDKNDEKFFTLLNQLEQNRLADKQNSEEANVKFDRVMTRLDRQGEENLRKIELMEKRFENEKLARLRGSTEYDTRLEAVQTQIAQQQSNTKTAHELSTVRLDELSESMSHFRQTEYEHFDILRDKVDVCNDTLYQSTERQRSVRSSVDELIEKSDTCLSFIDECSNVTKNVHSVAMETKSDVKALDRNIQGVSDTLSKNIHNVQGAV